MTAKISAAGALGLAILAAALPAEALYSPGNMCVQTSATGTPTYSFGRIGNSSTTQILRVECPQLRDGTGQVRGMTYALDRHTTMPVECTYMSCYVTETDHLVYFWSSSLATAGWPNRHQYMNHPWMQAVSHGFWFHACSIPPAQEGRISYVARYGTMVANSN